MLQQSTSNDYSLLLWKRRKTYFFNGLWLWRWCNNIKYNIL